MSDALDRFLGKAEQKGPETLTSGLAFASPESVIEQISRDAQTAMRSGETLEAAVARAQRKAFAEGKKYGAIEEFHNFERFRKQFGEEAARAIVREKMPEWRKTRKILASELAETKVKIRALSDVIEHAKAGESIIKEGGFVFKSRPYIMGNIRLRTHEILEQISSSRRNLLGGLDRDRPKTEEFFISLGNFVRRAEKFDIRSIKALDIPTNAGFSYELEREGLFVAPFPDCWFEWDVEPALTIAGLVQEHDGGGYRFSSLVRLAGRGWANWDYLEADDPNRRNELSEHVETVCRAAIVILASRSAEKTTIDPPLRANQRREKHGAPPLFSHTVVEIRGVVLSQSGVVTGRTHRSPRMHWRRGHLRRFRNEAGEVYRITPIAPMLVGSEKLGKIEHTYSVSSPPSTE